MESVFFFSSFEVNFEKFVSVRMYITMRFVIKEMMILLFLIGRIETSPTTIIQIQM